MDGPMTVGETESQIVSVCGERSMPPVSLRSVQHYKSQDEYVVVMKEDLAEWFNELYQTTMTADDLFDRLDTGILLCRYACLVDDVIRSRDIRSEPVVYRERGVEPGSFQARVNVAAFLAWCRRSPLHMPDDVLFETGDLICLRPTDRNERQVALSLLEVGRRSAAHGVGLPSPQLVRLEAEIDAEMRADDSALITDDVDNHDEEESLSNVRQSSVAFRSPSDAGRTRSIRPPSVNVRNSVETSTVSTETTQSERRGSAWQRRRYRPIIPVDMMSLDEMVRQILGRCTCPNQYPMIRVSEGKYRVGDNLTLIFVRILRQHVMVRIGGGWNTLDNYLTRCDPCRSQKNSASVAQLPTAAIITTTATTASRRQSATSGTEVDSQQERQVPGSDDRLNSSCSDLPSPSPPSEITMTTVAASSRPQPLPRRLSDLSLTSLVLPVGTTNCRPVYRGSSSTTTHDADAVTKETVDVRLDSSAAEGCSSCRDNDTSMTYGGSVYTTSTPRISDMSVLSSTSSSPSLAAVGASSSSIPVSGSCPRLTSDDARRRSVGSCRPSRIPVPLRVAAQSQSHSVFLYHGATVNSPINRHSYSHRHRRCDSGVDLNLSSPDFE